MRSVSPRRCLQSVVACVALCITLAGCGGRSAELEALMERNAATTDLGSQLTTIDQGEVQSYESGGEEVLGKPTKVDFFHVVTPGDGHTIDEVHAEVMSIVENDGWKLDDEKDCGDSCVYAHPDRDNDRLRIAVRDRDAGQDARLTFRLTYVPTFR